VAPDLGRDHAKCPIGGDKPAFGVVKIRVCGLFTHPGDVEDASRINQVDHLKQTSDLHSRGGTLSNILDAAINLAEGSPNGTSEDIQVVQ